MDYPFSYKIKIVVQVQVAGILVNRAATPTYCHSCSFGISAICNPVIQVVKLYHAEDLRRIYLDSDRHREYLHITRRILIFRCNYFLCIILSKYYFTPSLCKFSIYFILIVFLMS